MKRFLNPVFALGWPHQHGAFVYRSEVLKFLEDLEKDQNIHVVMSKIRFMKEHLK